MSLLSENVIPGDHGKVFDTDANEREDLEKLQQAIMKIDGIKDVLLDETDFPTELTIHTTSVVKIDDIQDAANKKGFHVVPKTLFSL